MSESEKMIVFGLAALFHAARIHGATVRGESQFPNPGNSVAAAKEFMAAADAAEIVPDLPDDRKR